MACVSIYQWCGKITAVQLSPIVRMMDWSYWTPVEHESCASSFFIFFIFIFSWGGLFANGGIKSNVIGCALSLWFSLGLFALPRERPNSLSHPLQPVMLPVMPRGPSPSHFSLFIEMGWNLWAFYYFSILYFLREITFQLLVQYSKEESWDTHFANISGGFMCKS